MQPEAIGVHPAVGIAAWSFHRRFQASTMDYPQFFAAVRGLGVRLVELNSPFFRSQDAAYIASIRHAADGYGITIVNLAVDDFGYDLSSADEADRQQAVARTVAWLDTAVALGCEHVRNNTGGADLAQCTRSFSTLAAEARARGRRIAIEAHGGFSADADRIAPLVREVRRQFPDQIGLIPDFGNVSLTPARDRYQQIAAMAPYAFAVHPKMHDFDEFGQQPAWDVPRLVAIVLRGGITDGWQAGFAGPWIIEFEGEEEEFGGLRKSIVLLSRCLKEC